MNQMPKGVRVIGIFFEVLSFFPFITGVALLYPSSASRQIVSSLVTSSSQNIAVTWPLGLTFIITGAIVFCIARALIKGKKWAWWAMLVLLVLNGLSQLGGPPSAFVDLILVIYIIYFLTRKDIRASFSSEPKI